MSSQVQRYSESFFFLFFGLEKSIFFFSFSFFCVHFFQFEFHYTDLNKRCMNCYQGCVVILCLKKTQSTWFSVPLFLILRTVALIVCDNSSPASAKESNFSAVRNICFH